MTNEKDRRFNFIFRRQGLNEGDKPDDKEKTKLTDQSMRKKE